MPYNADSLKKQYKKTCLEQRKKNLIRLREEIAGLSKTEFSKQTGIQKPNLSCLENGDRDMSLFNIQVYKTYFLENHKLNVSTDYLLGYTSVISNTEMNISSELGLSGKSIEVLKSWNELKKNPNEFAVAYGSTDIDALNLLLEDYYNLSIKAKSQDALADWSIFHHIYNYVFSEHLKKHPYNIVRYKHAPDTLGVIRSELKKGDIIISKGIKHTVEEVETYNERNFISTSDNFSIFNDTNQDETYTISFQNVMDSYTKDNILKILERIKKRVKGGK